MKKDCIHNRFDKKSIYDKTHELYNTDNRGCHIADFIIKNFYISYDECCEKCKNYTKSNIVEYVIKNDLWSNVIKNDKRFSR